MPTGLATGVTQYVWTVPQGALVRLQIPVLDATGAPFTVTGWSADATIHTPGSTVLYTWPSGDITVSGTTVTLTILPAESALWTFYRGLYRVNLHHPTDATQIYRIVEGDFFVDPS